MATNLSTGAIASLRASKWAALGREILQVIHATTSAGVRRVVLSDGVHYQATRTGASCPDVAIGDTIKLVSSALQADRAVINSFEVLHRNAGGTTEIVNATRLQNIESIPLMPLMAPPAPVAPAAARAAAKQPVIHAIADLSPHMTNWAVKAMISEKSDIRTFPGRGGPGCVFNLVLCDADQTKIKAVAFGDVARTLHDTVELDRTYTISGGSIKAVRDRRWNNLPHDYEISLDKSSVFTPAEEKMKRAFVPSIDRILLMEAKTSVDVIGMCIEVGQLGSITTKKQTQLSKREVVLADNSRRSVVVTLWGEMAERVTEDDWQAHIVGITGCTVSEYRGDLGLSAGFSSRVLIDPADAPASVVAYDPVGHPVPISASAGSRVSASLKEERGVLSDVTVENTDKTIVFLGTITELNYRFDQDRVPWYTGCAVCKKKVAAGPKSYYCEKCNRDYPDQPVEYYMLSAKVTDSTSTQSMMAFGDHAKLMLGGITAAQLAALHAGKKEYEYDAVFAKAKLCRFLFKVRAKLSETGDLRVNIVGVYPPDYVSEADVLKKEILSYEIDPEEILANDGLVGSVPSSNNDLDLMPALDRPAKRAKLDGRRVGSSDNDGDTELGEDD